MNAENAVTLKRIKPWEEYLLCCVCLLSRYSLVCLLNLFFLYCKLIRFNFNPSLCQELWNKTWNWDMRLINNECWINNGIIILNLILGLAIYNNGKKKVKNNYLYLCWKTNCKDQFHKTVYGEKVVKKFLHGMVGFQKLQDHFSMFICPFLLLYLGISLNQLKAECGNQCLYMCVRVGFLTPTVLKVVWPVKWTL